MAHGDTFTPRGAADEIKIRGPVWVGVWSFLTLGIYAVYWIYVTAKHLKAYGDARGQDLGQKPGMTLLAFLLGWILLFIPPLVALFRQGKRIQQAQQLAGVQPMNGWLALVLYIVLSPVYFAYEQSELNKAWGAEGGPVPTPDGQAPALTSAEHGSPLATTTEPVVETQPVSSPERPGGVIQHVALETREGDAEAEVRFWALLGFAEVDPPATLRARSRWVERAGTQVHLMFAGEPVAPPDGHVAVVAEDYDATVARLRDRGFAPQPREEHWGAARAFVRSPGGHRVELMARAPGAGA